MEEKTIGIIENLGGEIKYKFADDGKVKPIVEFPPDPDDSDRPALTFDPSDEPSFVPVLLKICETVDSIQNSAADIIFLIYYAFYRKHNLLFFFGLIDRGVPFEQAFNIIQSVYFVGYIADGESPSDTMLDYMLIIAEHLASEVSTVLLSFTKENKDAFWQKKCDQPDADLSDIGITEEQF